MPKIEMLNDEGNVTEVVLDVHRCVGDSTECEPDGAMCEDCGRYATAETPVYVWTTRLLARLTYFACSRCLAADAYARLIN
jgi:hypothetical protein